MAIKNISNFVTELRKISRNRNFEFYFRGHSDVSFDLKPSIYRQRYIKNESIIFKEFILKSPNDFVNEKSALEKLVKMQHYGIPTRLLDLTTNPLVALYFACKEKVKKNGQVLVFRIPKQDVKYYDSDTVSILANIAKRSIDFNIINYSRERIEFNNSEHIAYLLHEIKEEKSYFQSIIDPNDIERVVAVKVKQSNSRIIKQSGAFLIFGIKGEKSKPAIIPNEWILNLNAKGVDFEINNDSKDEILEELDLLGINEATLFPELENQALYIKRQNAK